MARDNPSHESSQDRHKPQPVKPQGREAGARKAERERVRSGPRRMKRRTGNPEPQTKPAEREPSTSQKTQAARKQTWTTGTRALSPLTENKTGEADRNDPARRATGVGESKKNPRQQNTEADEEAKGGPRKSTSEQRNLASGSHRAWSGNAQPKDRKSTTMSRRTRKSSTKKSK